MPQTPVGSTFLSMSLNKIAFLWVFISACGNPLPYSGTVRENQVNWQTVDAKIHATLCRARKAESNRLLPGIVLIAGTPGDRDWNASPMVINSGLVLARALSVAGSITLRYDPPGRGQSAKMQKLSRDSGVEALQGAHNLLRKTAGCDPKKIIWIAHGDAALTALSTATRVQPWKIILLCPPATSMQDSLVMQITEALKRRGLSKTAIRKNISVLKKGLRQLYSGRKLRVSPEGVEPALLHALEKLHNPRVRSYSSWFLRNSPIDRSLHPPSLVLMGGQDHQYPPETHKKGWLRRGVPVSKVIVFPQMDHMLKIQRKNLTGMVPGEILRTYMETERPLSRKLLQKLIVEMR